MKNFGFIDEVTVVAPGINGKMSEFNAALGLLQLKHIGEVLERRKVVDLMYRRKLSQVSGISCLGNAGERVANYAYFPVLVGPEYSLSRDALYEKLRACGVHARRYFYPLISDFEMYRDLPSAASANLPVAKKAASQVICLPIYPDLSEAQVEFVSEIISGRAA